MGLVWRSGAGLGSGAGDIRGSITRLAAAVVSKITDTFGVADGSPMKDTAAEAQTMAVCPQNIPTMGSILYIPQLFERKQSMKSLALFAILSLCALSCTLELSSDVDSTEALEVDEQKSSSEAMGETASKRTPVSTSSSGTWDLHIENCGDLFVRACTASFPSPQCPTVSEGQPCSPINSICWQTINGTWVRQFDCY
jgi:hypothetical protein